MFVSLGNPIKIDYFFYKTGKPNGRMNEGPLCELYVLVGLFMRTPLRAWAKIQVSMHIFP